MRKTRAVAAALTLLLCGVAAVYAHRFGYNHRLGQGKIGTRPSVVYADAAFNINDGIRRENAGTRPSVVFVHKTFYYSSETVVTALILGMSIGLLIGLVVGELYASFTRSELIQSWNPPLIDLDVPWTPRGPEGREYMHGVPPSDSPPESQASSGPPAARDSRSANGIQPMASADPVSQPRLGISIGLLISLGVGELYTSFTTGFTQSWNPPLIDLDVPWTARGPEGREFVRDMHPSDGPPGSQASSGPPTAQDARSASGNQSMAPADPVSQPRVPSSAVHMPGAFPRPRTSRRSSSTENTAHTAEQFISPPEPMSAPRAILQDLQMPGAFPMTQEASMPVAPPPNVSSASTNQPASNVDQPAARQGRSPIFRMPGAMPSARATTVSSVERNTGRTTRNRAPSSVQQPPTVAAPPPRQASDSSFIIDNACVVCFSSHISTMYYPCGHALCCRGCAQRIQDDAAATNTQSSCPFCRAEIKHVLVAKFGHAHEGTTLAIDNACISCDSAHVDSVFYPCTHSVCCRRCAARLSGHGAPGSLPLCPACNTGIRVKLKLFRP